jgi:hypothetical protein
MAGEKDIALGITEHILQVGSTALVRRKATTVDDLIERAQV